MSETTRICIEMRRRLVDQAFGEQSPAERSDLDAHLLECSGCRQYASTLSRTVSSLDKAPTMTASRRFDAQLARRLRTEREREVIGHTLLTSVLIALVRRMRRFELGAAVYPLVALAFAYVTWAMLTAEPKPRVYDYGAGDFIVRPLSPKTDHAALVELAKLERDAALQTVRPSEKQKDPYVPGEFVLHPPEFVTLRPLDEFRDPLEDLAALFESPDRLPAIEDIVQPPSIGHLTLPAGGPGGSGLAHARYMTIKNDKLYMRRAIASGLIWLSKTQREDGSWASDAGPRTPYSEVEITAAAALAYMQSGFTPYGNSEASRRLKTALRWLVRKQGRDGWFETSPARRPLAAQAMAVVALSEAIRLTDSDAIRHRFAPVVKSAMAALIARQTEDGSWDGPEANTMALLAASSARAAGVRIHEQVQDRAIAWMKQYRTDAALSEYSASASASAGQGVSYPGISILMCLPPTEYQEGEAETVTSDLRREPVVWESGDFFRWYVGTLAAYRLEGQLWQQWRNRLLVQLVREQKGVSRGPIKQDSNMGSWDAHGVCRAGGRPYATAMAVLTLSASYGHSPLYGSLK